MIKSKALRAGDVKDIRPYKRDTPLYTLMYAASAIKRKSLRAGDVKGIRGRAGRYACSLELVPYLEIDFFISEPLHLCGLLQAHGHHLSFMVLLTLCQHSDRTHLLTHTRVALRREDEGELRGAGDKHRRRTRWETPLSAGSVEKHCYQALHSWHSWACCKKEKGATPLGASVAQGRRRNALGHERAMQQAIIGQARAKCGTSSGGNTSSLVTVKFNKRGGGEGKPHAKTLAIVVGGAFFVSDASELPTFRSCTRVRARERSECFTFCAPVTLGTVHCLDSLPRISHPFATGGLAYAKT